ncbi:DUF5082 family protein [Salipaludibacillus agaradhaerens]|uniref:DUF5082 family protein n=1 Tax=Salipaludibacillus agaradhaerens TaxID=76935 RepID=A0A9Q4B3K0_SALAG|nr:DUF5082 domain-containing protein [Salipaludibacillus agaradhaerens]MCR6097694.1 DUF5082 family protein [Salipaludibacillus agaradhaerens]MCR6112822.1 DUF5082 family protein [Salipaludibacillus agaradhaerens]
METSQLRAEYSSKQSQLLACQAEHITLEEELEFVRQKKTELQTLKNDVIQNRVNALTVNSSIDFLEWVGSNYATFAETYVDRLCHEKYTNYINEIDDNLDALVDEERRLENKLLENDGLIGKLRQGLNWLSAEIEKLIN